MRRFAAAVLAVPVLLSIYLALAVGRSTTRRIGAGAAFIAVLGVGALIFSVLSASPPAQAVAAPPSPSPVVAAASPAPTAAVEAAVASAPPAAQPSAASTPTPPVSTGTGAGSGSTGSAPTASEPATGNDLGQATLSAAVVKAPTAAKILASNPIGKRIKLTSGFIVKFNHPVKLAAASAALTIQPAVKGTLKPQTAGSTNTSFVFVPSRPLVPNTAYTIKLAATIKDAQGSAIGGPAVAHLLTVPQPKVMRFRPATKSTGIDPTALISVRFSQAMDPASTARAFSANIAGKKIAGTVAWAEHNTVLVFHPAKAFPKGTGVGVRITVAARSAAGVALNRGISFTFKIVPKPAAPKATKPATSTTTSTGSKPSTTTSAPPSSGDTTGGGSWGDVETYYLSLMNCTRTGGWVSSSGTCTSPGGRSVAPLWIDSGISDKVTRPYAKYLATHGLCNHFYDGTPGDRLSRAGYTSYKWAENIGCLSMSPNAAMVAVQQYFQNERSYNGGHYVNLMNPLYDRVGLGVWVSNGFVLVVIDFYRP